VSAAPDPSPSPAGDAAPLVSVVICTHDRARHLGRALESVLLQRAPDVDFEVVVVDNRSTDDTAAVVRSFGADVRYVYEEQLGLCHARNRGWRSARGRWIAYLDDDAVASPGWLATIAETFAGARDCGVLGGKVEPIWEAPSPPWLSEGIARSLTIVDWTEEPRCLDDLEREWLVGANLAAPRAVLAEVGGFRPQLDRVGTRMLSGGDVFFQKEVTRRGWRCLYHPAMAVRHLVPAERLEKAWFVRRFYWQGVSDVTMWLLERSLSRPRRARLAAVRATRLLRPRTLRDLLLPTRDPQRFERKCLAWLAAGQAAGLLGAAEAPPRRLRVRVLRTHYPHWGERSGLHQYLRHLDGSRCEARVKLVSDGDDDFPVRSAALRRLLRDRVHRRGIEYYKLSDLVAEVRALRHCLLRRVDVLHYLDGEHGAQYLPLLADRLPLGRTRLVATFHQPAPLLARLLSPEVVSRLDHVTLVSPCQAEYFRPLLPAERISVILHGIDTHFFRPGAAPRGDARLRCITVGHWLRDWQAVRAVARAFARVRDVEFHVVTSRENGLQDLPNVHPHRNVSDERLRELYQGADVLFLPFSMVTAANSLLEGMACGLPVLSSRLPGVEAYLPRDAGMLVEGNATEALVEALASLRRDPEPRREMGRRARLAAEELAWPRIARRYAELYESLGAGAR
jgi:glycosyltransferase involved in cell wall biosynthesis